ncbi:uncharacterized protein TM35_000491150 [Trypanosoma theileri]|uniref:Uncharacterized protein n=1 Tax=Trypanosoma theileri TaxID=67003 RepID=A0A1X0NIU6_9TRYP|nr:uncharacterized protein TM35_000491150 [Trypanosoma theileri]ORC84109.1 hypothetical protein TM35_000491150 [Trypanosoma theileri]
MTGGEASGKQQSSLDEPPAKVARHEKESQEQERVTLYIRCAQIHSRGELMNSFLAEHREELGIQGWYNTEENTSTSSESTISLRPDAPVECVFMKTSRKPYFLLECTANKKDATSVVEKLILLHNKTYKDHPVIIEIAKDGLTVSGERKKLELRDAAKRTPVASSTSAPVGPSTTTSFVPRVLLKR